MPQVCTACCSQRKRLLIASAAEGVPGTDALIQRKFVDQWKINWSHGAPPAKVIEDLQALSETDKVKPIQLCGHSTEDVSLSLPAVFCSHSIKRLRRLPLILQSECKEICIRRSRCRRAGSEDVSGCTLCYRLGGGELSLSLSLSVSRSVTLCDSWAMAACRRG